MARKPLMQCHIYFETLEVGPGRRQGASERTAQAKGDAPRQNERAHLSRSPPGWLVGTRNEAPCGRRSTGRAA